MPHRNRAAASAQATCATWLIIVTACGISDPGRAEPVGCLAAYADIKDSMTARFADAGNDAALIVRVDGKTVCRLFVGAYTPETRVATASAAKWLTAATVLTLVDQGALRLNSKTAEFFPTAPAATAGITLTQLLSHTSGLLWFSRCMGRRDDTLQECAQSILESDQQFEPGTQFFYAGPPFTVAGAMAERATGTKWETIFRLKIGDPLAMSHTSYGDSPNPALSEGEMVSNADDYARFAQMILDGGVYAGRRLLSDAAIAEMRRNRTAGLPVASSPVAGTPYGLGVWLEALDAAGNGTVLSSPGVGGFVPIVDFNRRMVVVLTVQDEKLWPAINAMLAHVRAVADRER